MKLIVRALPLVAVALGIVASPALADPRGAAEYSLAYKLAAIDCRCVPSNTLVARYGRVLTTLTKRKCKESKQKLADMSVVATGLLRDEGIRVSNLRMLNLVNQSIPNSIGFRQPCRDIMAILVAQMT